MFGEDVVTFNFDVSTDEEPAYVFPVHFYLKNVLEYLEKSDFPLYNYINKIRSTIDAWGPSEGRIMNELGDTVDFKTIIHNIFVQENYYSMEHERWKKILASTPQQMEKITEVVDDLQKNEVPVIAATNNYYAFCETADKALRKIAVEVYPEILDMGEEKVKELRYLFTREIRNMQEKLVAFVDKNKNSI